MTDPDPWRRRARSFGSGAAAYANLRPDYADDAVDWALAGAARPLLRVADVGAGTGLLTAALVKRCREVVAVDPDPAMLDELRRRVPGAAPVCAPAEALPLADGSLDAVLVATAFHWFDRDRAVEQAARVLRPGGVLATLYDLDDDAVPWVAEVGRLSRTTSSLDRGDWDRHRDWLADSRFEPTLTERFPHRRRHTAASLTAAVGTKSQTRVVPAAEREATLTRVRAFLDAEPATSTGEFDLPLVTVVSRARRR